VTLRGVRLVFRSLGRTAPRLAGRLAARIFFRTQRFPQPARERAALASAAPHTLWRGRGERLAWWSWGESGPTVLLVHGWSGRGGQLVGFVEPLLAAGYRVATFDAVGHGASSGTQATLIDIAEDIRRVAAETGPIHAIVAHSAGGPSSALALLSGVSAARVVLVAPPLSAVHFLDGFSQLVGVEGEAKDTLRALVEARVGVDFDELDMRHLAGAMNVDMLVIHDEDDRDVPLASGVAVANAFDAELIVTDGLGHHRILRDAQVIDTIVRFINQEDST
jgi:pimeloyl-ACP methyl ester carboxylesterase